MEQEHRITYKAGITRTPSDFLCQDGELAECINLVTDNEELKPMVQPAEYMTLSYPTGISQGELKLFYIHKFANVERYIIGYRASENDPWTLYYQLGDTMTVLKKENGITDFSADPATIKIASIGRTLIATDKDGISYFLWKKTTYLNMGPLPEQDVDFWLVCEEEPATWPDSGTPRKRVVNGGSCDGMVVLYRDEMEFGIDHQDEYNDLIIGLYSKNVKEIAKQKKFCKPFYVRTALKMYDGTYTKLSQPILMFPCITDNTFCVFDRVDAGDKYTEIEIHTNYAELHYRLKNENLAEWSDIVKDVTVFISDGIETHNLGIDQFPKRGERANPVACTFDGIFWETQQANRSTYLNGSITYSWALDKSYFFAYQALRKKEKKDLINDLKGVSIFYRLCDIGIEQNTDTDIAARMESGVLENITTQERVDQDGINAEDFYSRCVLYPELIYPYNSRLNLANIRRSMYEGYDFFMPYDYSSPNDYDFYVKIQTDLDDVWVHHQKLQTKQMQGGYFYYPDSRAKHVVIYKNGTCCLDEKLTEHPGLNGAYFFKGLPGTDFIDDNSTVTPAVDPRSLADNDYKEYLPNYLIQSEVNNPWVFKAEGYHKVSIGRIMAISACTQALSQSQYGPYPLLVFSTNGIWNMSVDATGLYSDMQPISRDVLLNEHSVTQTDNAIFFVSKKGLMVAKPYRSTWIESVCVSEQMNGVAYNTANLITFASDAQGGTPDDAEPWKSIIKACQTNRSFLDYIRDEACFMAYDYIDSRILIINPNFSFVFAYHMADGTISKTILPAPMTGAVNNYPDYLIQGTVTETVEAGGVETEVTVQKLYSFYEKPREEEVIERTMAFVLTRPMKLAGPVSQASLRQLKNVGTWAKGTEQTPLSCVKTEIYLSSDMQTWYNDPSRFGAAARYYRLALFIKMLPTERLSGTILTEQERRNNNMR